MPIDRQRLIFRGKQLKDEDSVNTCKISDLDVIHLVAKTNMQTVSDNTTETDPPTLERERERGFSSIFNVPSFPRGVFNLNQPPLMTSIGRRRRHNREDNTGKNILNYFIILYPIL